VGLRGGKYADERERGDTGWVAHLGRIVIVMLEVCQIMCCVCAERW